MRGSVYMLVLAIFTNLPAVAQHDVFDIRENIRVEARLDKASCYPGEPVLLTYRVYTALQSTSVIMTHPRLEGFISKEVTNEYAEPEEETIGSKRFRVIVLWQVQLTARQPGQYSIGGLSVDNEVSYTADDGSMRHYSGVVSSDSLIIRVLPLPAGGAGPATLQASAIMQGAAPMSRPAPMPDEETVLDVQRSRLVLLGSLLGLLLTSWVIVALHRRRVRGETGQEVASKPDDIAADW